jgi:hypothetical protein
VSLHFDSSRLCQCSRCSLCSSASASESSLSALRGSRTSASSSRCESCSESSKAEVRSSSCLFVGTGTRADSPRLPPVIPGIVYVMTTFYKRSELAFRIGVFLSLGPGLSGAFGGLLAAGLLKHDYAGLVSWQRIFVLEVSSRISSLAPERLPFPDLRRATLTFKRHTGNPYRLCRCRHLLHASRRTGQDSLAERGRSRTRRPPP